MRSDQERGTLKRSKFFSEIVRLPVRPCQLLAPTPSMNRPVGASSTDVMMSANERLGNGSWRSGPTSLAFRPGTLGIVPGGSPPPTGGVLGAEPGGATTA